MLTNKKPSTRNGLLLLYLLLSEFPLILKNYRVMWLFFTILQNLIVRLTYLKQRIWRNKTNLEASCKLFFSFMLLLFLIIFNLWVLSKFQDLILLSISRFIFFHYLYHLFYILFILFCGHFYIWKLNLLKAGNHINYHSKLRLHCNYSTQRLFY